MYKYSTFSLLVESLLKVLHAHAVLGLRKFGACSAVSVGRLTLVEGGLVWLVKALVRTFFRILFWYAYENIHTKRYWNSCLYYLVGRVGVAISCKHLGLCIWNFLSQNK